jgi:beta-glucosidase
MSAPGDADLRNRVARLSLEQKVRLLTGADFWALYAVPDAGLRRVVTSDGPAGVRGETWDERDTSANYRGYDRDGREPLFPFGHGRGYTSWSYESITVPPGASGICACIAVRNTGTRPGREVVQVYASRPESSVERPAKWLVGFAAVDADPGETVGAGILIPERAFQHWADGGWALEAGSFTLSAGSSSASLPLTAEVTVK